MSTQTPAKSLFDADQLAQFQREGYVVVDDVFDEEILSAIEREITTEIDARAAELVKSGELSRTYAEADFLHRLALISAETDKVARDIWNGSLAGPAVFNLIRNPALLDVAERLCGSGELIASSVYRLRPKIPGSIHSPVPWHQDSGYMEPYCDKAMVLTVWLPLVDATEENGCLWVLPRSHHGNVLEHNSRPGKPYLLIVDENLPAVEPVCVPVRRGGALFMTNLTPHASFENKTDTVRWSMDLRYQSAALPTNAAITRLPGEAVADPAAGVPVACYPPEADFLVRSRLRPDEVITDPSEFARIRHSHGRPSMTNRWKALA
jgi:ectoine hydroxylase-related dioxygenase (phytanoyl-CoA dioxygenase family)